MNVNDKINEESRNYAAAAARIRAIGDDRRDRGSERVHRLGPTDYFQRFAWSICPQCGCALLTYVDGWALAHGQRVPSREILCARGHRHELLMIRLEEEPEEADDE